MITGVRVNVVFFFNTQEVKFPLSLDVYDLCTEELQKKLMPMREKFKEDEDAKVEEARKVCVTGWNILAQV